jgi:hypothetical protein
MLKKITVLFLSLTLCLTTVACGSNNSQQQSNNNQNVAKTPQQKPLTDGKYPVQQANYNDVNGEYTLMLLNTPPGYPATYKVTNLQMARLKDEEVKAGESSYLKVEKSQPALYIKEDFKIEYVHNVTETQTNPQTGQKQVVVVRQESSFWTPFAGAIAGQLVANALFTPQYYMPPVYQPGGVMRGYGGYGNTYDQAVSSYQSRYNSPPPAVTNRTVLRTTGKVNSAPSNTVKSPANNNSRGTGSGFGSSDLGSSGKSNVQRSSGFGSGGARRSSGGRRR